jgi:hypothetical protein
VNPLYSAFFGFDANSPYVWHTSRTQLCLLCCSWKARKTNTSHSLSGYCCAVCNKVLFLWPSGLMLLPASKW